MTLASSTSKIQYAPGGATSVFSFPYLFLDDTHLLVILTSALGVDTTQVLNTDYTVSGAGSLSGGNITMTTPPASGTTLTIARVVPITQLVDYISNDSFPAETHETALDKLTMICQAVNEMLSRCLRFPTVAASTEVSILPNATARASTVLYFNASGNAGVLSISSLLATIGPVDAGTLVTLGSPVVLSANKVTIDVTVNATGLYIPIRAWFVSSALTAPSFARSIVPPSEHASNLIEAVTATDGTCTLTLEHIGAATSWKLVVEVGGVLLLSSAITMGT